MFDSVDRIGGILGLYDAIKKRFSNDYIDLKNAIKSTVKKVCKDHVFNMTLNGLPIDYPDDLADIIVEETMHCIANKTRYTYDKFLSGYTCNEEPKLQLYEQLATELEKSNLYREFDIISGLDEKSDTILEKMSPNIDSVKKMHSKSVKINSRFHFNSETVDFHGRDNEIKRLLEFCDVNKDDTENNSLETNVKWWTITGEGGLGKTRLAYELLKIMEEKRWSICVPPDHSLETLRMCSENIINDSLFVLDYSAKYIRNIVQWINYMIADNSINKKVRVLLIERMGSSLNNSKWFNTDALSSNSNIYAAAYNNGDFLRLNRIDEEGLHKIYRSYAYKRNFKIEEDIVKQLYDVLAKIDAKLLRPLYGLFIVDAYIEGENPLIWSREDALNYVTDREIKSWNIHISRIFGNNENLLNSYKNMIMMATICGTLVFNDDIDNFLHDEIETLKKMCEQVNDDNLLIDIGLTRVDDNGDQFCGPLLPDLLGEFYVIKRIKQIKESKGARQAKKYISKAWNRHVVMKDFMERLYSDYTDVLIDENIEDIFSNIELDGKMEVLSDGFFEQCDFIKSIIIPDGVLSIGDRAFSLCKNLENVVMPNSIIEIGEQAFFECRKLTAINFPRNIHTINAYTFCGCTSLKKIELPKYLLKIGCRAFCDCRGITDIKVPKSVYLIDEGAFYNCTSLITAELNSDIKEICAYTFYNCKNLKSLELPSSIKTIGRYAFAMCESIKTIENIYLIDYIHSYAFYKCKSLLRFNTFNVKYIDEGAFSYCLELNSIEVSNNINVFQKKQFQGCINLKIITCSENITQIAESAFEDCRSLVLLPKFEHLQIIGSKAFKNCWKLSDFYLCDGITTIGVSAFENCKSLKEIIIPANVKRINSYVFTDCSNLSSVILHDNITHIDSAPFERCHIKRLTIPYNLMIISEKALIRCCVDEVVIKRNLQVVFNSLKYVKDLRLILLDEIVEFEDHMFEGMANLEYICIPESIQFINSYLFSNCINLQQIDIPNKLNYIGEKAFSNCNKLLMIKITSVNEIHPFAFKDCINLREVIINSVKQISTGAFFACQNLESISVESNLLVLGVGTFRECYNLKNVCFPDTLKEISADCFLNCKAIESFSLPTNVENLGASAFEGCKKLSNIVLNESLITINEKIFYNCSELIKIKIPNGITEIPSKAFSNCINLKNVQLSSALLEIGEYSFSNCTNLENVEGPSTLLEIGKYSFSNCTNLKNVELPSTLLEIGEYSFSNCISLKMMNLPQNLRIIGRAAFEHCISIEQINIPHNIIVLRNKVFLNCKNLSIIQFEGDLTSIENDALSGTAIKFLHLPDSFVEMHYIRTDYNIKIDIPISVEKISFNASLHYDFRNNLKLSAEEYHNAVEHLC